MKTHETDKHPGPWRIMRVDSGFAGILIAIGFLAMGFVSMPVGKWFVFATLLPGLAVALSLRHLRKT